MNKKKRCFCHLLIRWLVTKVLFILFLSGTALNAQSSRTVEGKIVDSNQDPLYGVTILVKNKPGVGTITDFEGKFSINLQPEDTILMILPMIGILSFL